DARLLHVEHVAGELVNDPRDAAADLEDAFAVGGHLLRVEAEPAILPGRIEGFLDLGLGLDLDILTGLKIKPTCGGRVATGNPATKGGRGATGEQPVHGVSEGLAEAVAERDMVDQPPERSEVQHTEDADGRPVPREDIKQVLAEVPPGERVGRGGKARC